VRNSKEKRPRPQGKAKRTGRGRKDSKRKGRGREETQGEQAEVVRKARERAKAVRKRKETKSRGQQSPNSGTRLVYAEECLLIRRRKYKQRCASRSHPVFLKRKVKIFTVDHNFLIFWSLGPPWTDQEQYPLTKMNRNIMKNETRNTAQKRLNYGTLPDDVSALWRAVVARHIVALHASVKRLPFRISTAPSPWLSRSAVTVRRSAVAVRRSAVAARRSAVAGVRRCTVATAPERRQFSTVAAATFLLRSNIVWRSSPSEPIRLRVAITVILLRIKTGEKF
jgi:hypothetical protein